MRRVPSAICVLLVLAFAVGWVAGRWSGTITIESWNIHQGTMSVCIDRDALLIQRERRYQLRVNKQPPRNQTINLLFFRWSRDCSSITEFSGENLPGWSGMWPTVVSELAVPFWSAMLSSGIWPLIALYRGPLCRHRRREKGLCITCGYNLTGNVSGNCSECGQKLNGATS